MADRNNSFLLFLETVARRRSFIFAFVFVVTLVSVVISLILPKWYEAEALLLPPKDLTLPLPSAGSLNELVSITEGLDLPMMVTPSDVFARVLESRTIASRLIEEYDLQNYYGKSTMKKTIVALLDHATFKVTDEGLLTIAVEDKDPQMAANLTNSFVDELDRVNRDIAAARIKQNRAFIESRVDQVKVEMDSARSALEQFQMKYRTVDFDEQSRLAIEQAIKLKVKLAEIDFDMQVLEKNMTEHNSEFAELKRRKQIINGQLQQLEQTNPDTSFFSLPISSIPSLRSQYEVLYSRVKVAESLHRILMEQLEQAKIQENEQLPSLTVVDRAVPPEVKSRPKRMLMVISTFVLAFIFAIFLAMFLDYLKRLKESNPEDYARLQFFGQAFFGWLPGTRQKTH